MATKINTGKHASSSSLKQSLHVMTEEESNERNVDMSFSQNKAASHQEMENLKSFESDSQEVKEDGKSNEDMTDRLPPSSNSMPNNPLLSQTQSGGSPYMSTSVQEPSQNSSVCPNPIRQQQEKDKHSGSNILSSSCQGSPALPNNLRQILQEVAKTGRCAKLSWDYPATFSEVSNQQDYHEYPIVQNQKSHNLMQKPTTLKQPFTNQEPQTSSREYSGRKRPLNYTTSGSTFPYIQSSQQLKVNHHHYGKDDLDKTIRRIDLQENSKHLSIDNMDQKDSHQILQIHQNKDNNKPGQIKKSDDQINEKAKSQIKNKPHELSMDMGIVTNKISDNQDGKKQHESLPPVNNTISLPTSIAVNNQSIKEKSKKPLTLRTLRDVLKTSIALVLDYSYKHQGGYKVNQAERKRYQSFMRETLKQTNNNIQNENNHTQLPEIKNEATQQAQLIYIERRNRLILMLSRKDEADTDSFPTNISYPLSSNDTLSLPEISINKSIDESVTKSTIHEPTEKIKPETGTEKFSNSENIDNSESIKGTTMLDRHNDSDVEDGPPFTIQRIAEVLVMPERYYTQTHKLCNALEKLLLVTSPNNAFGNFPIHESNEEERITQGTSNERNRENNHSDQKQRRLKRRTATLSSEGKDVLPTGHPENDGFINKTGGCGLSTEPRMLDASRITNSSEYDHEHKFFSAPTSATVLGGNGMLFQMINNGSTVSTIQDKYISMQMEPTGIQRQMIETLTPSNFSNRHEPQPQIVSHDSNISNMKGVSGDMQHHMKNDRDASINIQENLHTSVMFNQHPVARPPSPILFTSASPSSHNLNSIVHEHQRTTQVLQSNPSILAGDGNVIGSRSSVQMEILIDPSSPQPHNQNVSATTISSNLAAVTGSDMADFDGDQGRSSTSNSDFDSESDDVSLDDSASDRSDGSDSGPGTSNHEPYSAARMMALNRMQQQQQQQRREYFLQNRTLGNLANQQPNDSYRPQPDLEYQSGDSLDSMIAEDSGESDSSSSDVND